MEAKENCVSFINRTSRKRPLPIATVAGAGGNHQIPKQIPSTKKRVVLGDLTDSENVIKHPDINDEQKLFFQSNQAECVKNEVSLSLRSVQNKKLAYAPLMYQYLHSLEIEEKRRPLCNYMEKIQKDVTIAMREVLVDWLIEVAEEYKLVSDTLFLTVSYIDRFLSSHSLSRKKLQLLGVSSMLVASKYEEISPPRVEDYCYITDNSYTKEEVIEMEGSLLKFLNFEISNPTPKTFLRIFIKAAYGGNTPMGSLFEFLSCFLVELTLLNYKCLRFLPSMIAASAFFISRITLQPDKHPWGSKMQRFTGYKSSELKDCVIAIHYMQMSRRSFCRAVRDKYAQRKFLCVATLPCPSEIPAFYFESACE